MLPIGFDIARKVVTLEANSALPTAPVVREPVPAAPLRQVRSSLAGALHRAAVAVAPPAM